MNTVFRRSLALSTTLHVALVLGVLVFSLVSRWRQPPKRQPFVTYVDLTIPAADAPEVVPVDEIKPAPPPPKDIPEPPKTPKKTIEPSKKLVRRPQTPAPKEKTLTPEEVARLLAAGAKLGPASTPPPDDLPSWYYALVRQAMYDAWDQPGGSAPRGMTADVVIRVERDGAVSRCSMEGPSGNAAMDESVMQAARSVARLKPLPSSFPGRCKDITVVFELTE